MLADRMCLVLNGRSVTMGSVDMGFLNTDSEPQEKLKKGIKI
jgi:hypothetical protein